VVFELLFSRRLRLLRSNGFQLQAVEEFEKEAVQRQIDLSALEINEELKKKRLNSIRLTLRAQSANH
jgi:hypothetical protein